MCSDIFNELFILKFLLPFIYIYLLSSSPLHNHFQSLHWNQVRLCLFLRAPYQDRSSINGGIGPSLRLQKKTPFFFFSSKLLFHVHRQCRRQFSRLRRLYCQKRTFRPEMAPGRPPPLHAHAHLLVYGLGFESCHGLLPYRSRPFSPPAKWVLRRRRNWVFAAFAIAAAVVEFVVGVGIGLFGSGFAFETGFDSFWNCRFWWFLC